MKQTPRQTGGEANSKMILKCTRTLSCGKSTTLQSSRLSEKLLGKSITQQMEEGGGENDSDFIPFNSTNDKETELIQPGSKRQKLVNSITVPWFSRDGRTTLERRAPPLVRLHNEILTFCQFITPTPAEMKIREKTLSDVTAIIKAKWPDCSVKVFGSQLTKILTPNSDLDIAVLDVPSNIDLPEAMVDLALKIRQQMKVSYIEPVVNARVPILKFDHVDSGLSVDICINLDSGLRTGHMLVQLQKDYPPLLPLTLVLKTFLVNDDNYVLSFLPTYI